MPERPATAALAAIEFIHPEANQTLQLGAVRVAYQLQRARRRSIGLSIGVEGLSVRAPSWVSRPEIEKVLHGKAAWIVRKLQELHQRRQQPSSARLLWGDGLVLPYLGQPLQLCLDVTLLLQRPALRLEPLAGAGQLLRLGLKADTPANTLRDLVQGWFRQQARTHFLARLQHFAPQLGVRCTRLSLSNARTRWGSASADGSIRLHWRLMHFEPALIDYVVVHELAHLQHMDHSPQFWALVASILPHCQQLRQQLRQQVLPAWDE